MMNTNFSRLPVRRRQISNSVLIVILVLVFVLMLIEQESMTSEVEQWSLHSQQSSKSRVMSLPISEDDLRRSKEAEVIYKNLTFPWQRLLTGLETVKRDYKKVHYKAFAPVKSESSILLTAQTETVDDMLDFVAALEANATFQQVRLMNQQHNQAGALAFTVKIGWAE